MAVAARYFEFDKAQCDKLLITKDPSLIFSIVKVARDQTQPGSRVAHSRDPENEVDWFSAVVSVAGGD